MPPIAATPHAVAGSAKLFAARAISEGCDYIIAAGGDGTLNEVVNGIGRSSRIVRLGLLPLGTGNDFARCLRLPSSVDENIEILRAGKTKAIDMVKVTSDRVRYFVNVSAGGFSGMVDEKLTSRMKKTWGPLAYLRSAAAAFSDLHSYRTRVRFGTRAPQSYDLYNVIVANGRYIAGGWPIAPKANPSDGLLDVILIKKAPPADTRASRRKDDRAETSRQRRGHLSPCPINFHQIETRNVVQR